MNTSSLRRVVIVGGVAGGMSAATRLRRLDESVEIVVIERSGHVSYANCGLPYYVGGIIEDEDELILQTPERLHERFRLDVRTGTEALAIDAAAHEVTVRSAHGEIAAIAYDRIVLSPGAAPVPLAIPGAERVRPLHTLDDAERLAHAVARVSGPVVIVGGGFIGLETAESLRRAGVDVTIVEATGQVLPPIDPELAIIVAGELEAHGVRVLVGSSAAEVTAAGVVLSSGELVPAALVVGAIGVRPDVRLALTAGVELGPQGGIAVDDFGRTSVRDVYAVGDAVEKRDALDGAASTVALANIANRQGRRLADHICGLDVRPSRSHGTAIVKVFDLTVAITGWNEKRLRAAGRPFRTIRSHPMNHASYYPGAEQMSIKLVFHPENGEILGAQIVGGAGVDKRIDVIATAIAGGIPADALAELELAYAPQFSSAKDPVNMLGYMAENVLSGACDVVEPDEVAELVASGWTVLDVRTPAEHAAGAIPGSVNVPLDDLRDRLGSVGPGPFLVYCAVGQRGHTATSLLHELGYTARNLDGGFRTWTASAAAAKPPATTARG